MAISVGQVTLDESATIDKRLLTVTRTSGSDTVHSETFCIIDPDAASGDTAMARVQPSVAGLSDRGLVVRPVNSNRTASGALGALNAAVTLAAEGQGAVHFEVDTGTLVGTVVFEATLDDSTWFAIEALKIDGSIITQLTSFGDRGMLTSTGYSQTRLRVSAYTSGTSNARMEASLGDNVTRLGDSLPAGTNNIGDVDVLTLPSLPAGTNNIGDVDVLTLPALPAGTNNIGDVDILSFAAGAIVEVQGDAAHDAAASGNPVLLGAYAKATAPADVSADGDAVNLWADRAGRLQIGDGGGSLTVDGTVAVSGTVTVDEGANALEVVGDVADDAAAAGNPLLNGAVARTTDRSAVAAGDAVYLLADILGKLVTLPYATPDQLVSGVATLTATSDTAIIAAGGAGVRFYITSISASNTSATAVRVDFKDGTTVVASFYLAASGGGASHVMPVPIRGTANTAFNAALSAGVTDVRVSAQGYKAAA